MNGDDARNVETMNQQNDGSSKRTQLLAAELSEAERREFNQIIFAFEDAWQHDAGPDIAGFLPTAGPLRQTVLQELVRIDFEYRAEHDAQTDPANYLIQFPELTADPDQLNRLMRWFGEFSRTQRSDSQTRSTDESHAAYWAAIKPGSVLGNYVILEMIGRGGMGAVFKARHQQMNRIVALKTISPQAMRSADAIKRFRREVRASARLDHPNIITAHDADQFDDIHVLIMQYVDGQDLATRVRLEGPLSVEESVECITQAARGMEYAHQHGVIHRDIKPANLIRNKSGQLKILDLGLARIEDQLYSDRDDQHELTVTGEFLGTTDFMSPEQAASAKNASFQSDVYSLGCTLYFLLTGNRIFGGGSFVLKMLAHRDSPIPLLRDARPDVPLWLEHVFERMVAKQPRDRFQTMTELLAALSAKTEPAVNATSPTAHTSRPGLLPDLGMKLKSFFRSLIRPQGSRKQQ